MLWLVLTTQSIADVEAAQTLSFTWTEQFKVHFVASGNAVSVTVPVDEWVNLNGVVTGSFPLQVTVGGSRSNFVSDNRLQQSLSQL